VVAAHAKVAQEQLEGSGAEAEVTALLLAAVERAVGLKAGALASSAIASKLQLWGAAIPMNRWDGGDFAYCAAERIGVAGDWLSASGVGASTVEAAWTSGVRLAEHMASPEACEEDAGLSLGKRGGRFVPVDGGGFGNADAGKVNWVDEPSSSSSSSSSSSKERQFFAQRLFLHNLPYDMQDVDLVDELEAVTQPHAVASVQLLSRPDGSSRGMAKVRMQSDTAAATAVQALNGKRVWGRELRVNFEEKPTKGGRGKGRGRGRGRGRENR